MSNIPFEKQRLAVDPVEQIEHMIAQGAVVPGDELLHAIEWLQGQQLDDRVRDIILKSSIPPVKRRGRPSNCKAREDFALAELDARYPDLLQKYRKQAQQKRHVAAARGDTLARAEQQPNEMTYTEFKADFPSIELEALRNKHCDWKNGRYHPVKNDVDSEDFEAEIERQFPPPRQE